MCKSYRPALLHVEGIVSFMEERSSSNWKSPSEAMLVLTKNNFTKFTAKEELIVVIFYATWLAGFLAVFSVCFSVDCRLLLLQSVNKDFVYCD